jgi:formylglycine-generating enzyme required for sulfatase activity
MRSNCPQRADATSDSADINHRPFREAMGLGPGMYGRAEKAPLAAHGDLLSLTPEEISTIAEEPGQSFARRHAAGQLLGLLGDPRIRPLDPVMITIRGGTFHQGLDVDQVDEIIARWASVGVQRDFILKECPSHIVTLPAFRIAKYPVTNLEFLQFVVERSPTELPSSWEFGVYPETRSNHPVYTVSPETADSYATWLRARTGRRWRLPSEAEWEYAAAGGSGTEYPWGAEFDPHLANTVEMGPLCSTPVGIYPEGASSIGVLDMAGNVEEYVSDLYAPYPGGTFVEDELAQRGPYRIARGGSFTRYGDLARCRRRHGRFDSALYPTGFRLAEDP